MVQVRAEGPPTRRLRREVGLISLTFVSLGSIIGSGWLLGALTAAKEAGPASILSWVLAGVILAVLALIHAELGAAYPVAGGTARWPHLVFGPLGGFTSGWMAWLGGVALAPIEVEAALQYLSNIIPGLVNESSSTAVLTHTGIAVAVVLMAVFSLINIMGVRWLAETNTAAVWWKLAVPLLTIVVLAATSFHPSNFTAGGGFAPNGFKGILSALPAGVVFAAVGFEQAVQLGGESRNPKKDVPRAVVGAMVIGTLVYLLLEFAFIGALDPANLAHGWSNPISKGEFGPYAGLATSLGLSWLAVILYIDAFISPAGTGLVYSGTTPRMSYAMSRNGYLPPIFEKLNKRGIPWFSVLVTFVVGLVLLLPFPSWQEFVGFVTSAYVLMYAFAPVAFAALRRTDPDRARPYRVGGGAVLAPLGFVAANLVVYWSGWKTDSKLLLCMVGGFVLLGISYLTKANPNRPKIDWKAGSWIFPYLAGLALISYLGQFGNGTKAIPFGWDIAVIVVFSLAVFYAAVALSLPSERVAEFVQQEEAEAREGLEENPPATATA
ncbi:APC family permease [Gandjariella thermophila]|uniref:Amino acid permease n=1 Tax=Gandjariella thermophila TaxID=1931992 RepID=A0A4D4J1D0_9PSEU|nr:APC family permease [Gandjariella thermophila]GDY30435.1 amino acid permease [Gandjariella thermophila]